MFIVKKWNYAVTINKIAKYLLVFQIKVDTYTNLNFIIRFLMEK